MPELKIAGMGIAPEVLEAIVTRAVEALDGVAGVGSRDLASSLVSMLSPRTTSTEETIEFFVEEDSLAVTVHLAVFYGYPFKELAAAVRAAVAKAIDAQVGVAVSKVDVCIDGLVFPKEQRA